jgi:hypothetical protein
MHPLRRGRRRVKDEHVPLAAEGTAMSNDTPTELSAYFAALLNHDIGVAHFAKSDFAMFTNRSRATMASKA